MRTTPLHIAIDRHVGDANLALVQLLLSAGAPVNAVNSYGHTPLFLAVDLGHTGIVKALLDAGADPGIFDNKGLTPLHAAVSQGSTKALDMVPVLLGHAPVDLEDKAGDTALHLAAQLGDVRMVQLLLDHGAEPQAVNSKQQTALETAILFMQPGVVKLLLSRFQYAVSDLRTAVTLSSIATDECHSARQVTVHLLQELYATHPPSAWRLLKETPFEHPERLVYMLLGELYAASTDADAEPAADVTDPDLEPWLSDQQDPCWFMPQDPQQRRQFVERQVSRICQWRLCSQFDALQAQPLCEDQEQQEGQGDTCTDVDTDSTGTENDGTDDQGNTGTDAEGDSGHRCRSISDAENEGTDGQGGDTDGEGKDTDGQGAD
jgi:hypothetical protein